MMDAEWLRPWCSKASPNQDAPSAIHHQTSTLVSSVQKLFSHYQCRLPRCSLTEFGCTVMFVLESSCLLCCVDTVIQSRSYGRLTNRDVGWVTVMAITRESHHFHTHPTTQWPLMPCEWVYSRPEKDCSDQDRNIITLINLVLICSHPSL